MQIRKIILLALFFVSSGKPANANLFQTENLGTYATFVGGLIVKNTLSHHSKRLAINQPIVSITLRSFSDAVALFLLKETGEFAAQSFKDVAPDWLSPRKNNRLESENTKLRQQLEDFKMSSLATDAQVQANRINTLKEQILSLQLEITLSKIDSLLSCPTIILCSENSMEIANLLLDFAEKVLTLFPGFTNDKQTSFLSVPWNPERTGESYIYNETLVLEKSRKLRLKSRVQNKTIVYIKDNLEQLTQKNDRGKAEYFQHLFDLMGVEVELPELTTKSDQGTGTGDL